MSREQQWDNATWKGNRRAQLRASLKLTPKQRFEALEEMAETSSWLAGNPHRTDHVVENVCRLHPKSNP